MNIRLIKTENNYRTAVKRVELLFDAPVNSPETLINKYELAQ